jgi:hypothetical protein
VFKVNPSQASPANNVSINKRFISCVLPHYSREGLEHNAQSDDRQAWIEALLCRRDFP